MPSFPDSIFLFVLALLLFGPKRLPVLARELGKWVGEFRRASNEFKMQMEEELRLSEQTERQKKIAAMEAAAPVAPVIAEPVAEIPTDESTDVAAEAAAAESLAVEAAPETTPELGYGVREGVRDELVDEVREPLPIAVSGELKIMPPATGLPTAQVPEARNSALKGLLDAIPAAETASDAAPEQETTAHGN